MPVLAWQFDSALSLKKTGDAKLRLQCDGKKPKCVNCTKSRRLCTGYQRLRAFVLSKEMVSSEAVEDHKADKRPSLLPHSEEAESGPVLISRWRADRRKRHSTPSAREHRRIMLDRGSVVDLSSLLALHVFPRNVFRTQFIDLIIRHNFPAAVLEGQADLKCRHWLLQLPDLTTLTPALENAVLAICTARLGRLDGHDGLCNESLRLYSQSMADLRCALREPALRHHDQTLAACTALTMYELAECPGQLMDGYISHYYGAMALLELRESDVQSSLANSIMYSLRIQSVSARPADFTYSPLYCMINLLDRRCLRD